MLLSDEARRIDSLRVETNWCLAVGMLLPDEACRICSPRVEANWSKGTHLTGGIIIHSSANVANLSFWSGDPRVEYVGQTITTAISFFASEHILPEEPYTVQSNDML